MNRETIKKMHRQLEEFLKGDTPFFEFRVDCPLETRIEVIYNVIFPGWEKYKFYWRFFIARIAQFIDYSPLKIYLYRKIGVKIAKGVFISPDVILDPHFPSLIELGDYTILGWGVKIFTHEYLRGKYRIGRIRIHKGANIGAFSLIRGGVTIGELAEIAAHSIVYKDVPEEMVFGVRETLSRLKDSETT